MNNFEPKSKDELQQLFARLRSKSVDEIISLYGAPSRELERFQRERIHWDAKREVVEYRRALGFLGRGSTDHILWVYERSDGELEFFYTTNMMADPCANEDHSKYVA